MLVRTEVLYNDGTTGLRAGILYQGIIYVQIQPVKINL
ncbi:MAG: hypothetical protein UZ08_BCD001002262 [Candidatus Parvibacillus calidus]|jgi:hypothetical protein|nr:MAG: hypothetical protein UZ08_BCD001002262 [Candidatus Parvibacillus calidus]